jgi:predicted alpha/beta-hydrolase family hydrolase
VSPGRAAAIAALVEWAPGETVTARTYAAAAPGPFARLVLGHGAGADQCHPFMVHMAERLAARGVTVVTYNFAYTEKGRRLPDPAPKLEGCAAAAIAFARGGARAGEPLFVGGKSMGGRIASQVAARGDAGALAGLVFLGYPLHPPGKPEKARSAHLPDVRAPMLFVQGERDAFGTPGEIAPLIAGLARGTRLHAVAGGDHSLTVPRRGGLAEDVVLDGVADAIVAWMREVAPAPRAAGRARARPGTRPGRRVTSS